MSNPLSLCITVTVFLLFGAASGRAQDLHHDLAALAKLRDGTAKPLARVDQHGAELLAQYTDEKSQGEIYYLLAHIHAQSGQAQPRKTVEYAKNGLDYPLSPDQRMRLYVYAGDARSLSAFDDNEPFENARRAAAAFYLRGLKEIQSNHQLPDRLPVRPPPSAEDRQMSPDHPNFREWLQRQREESKKYEVDPLVKTMFEHRKVLMGQLVYLYSRRPYASGELRDLASNSLGDDNPAAKLMDQLDVKLASIPGDRKSVV